MPKKSHTAGNDHKPGDGQSKAPSKASERRRFKRLTTVINGDLFCAAEAAKGIILDLSLNGVKIKTDLDPPHGAPVTLTLGGSVHFGGEVAWRHGDFLGVSFSKSPESIAEILAPMMPAQYLRYNAA